MRRASVVISGLITLVIILSIVQIAVANAFATDGITLGTMQEKIATMDRENMMLKEKLYTASSYISIADHASSLGFVENKSQLVVGGVQPLAIRQ